LGAPPRSATFYKRHKEVTNVVADFWSSPFSYSMLQMLTQAIEAVGSMDRISIADHIRKDSVRIILGCM
jgi:hypothetical protein